MVKIEPQSGSTDNRIQSSPTKTDYICTITACPHQYPHGHGHRWEIWGVMHSNCLINIPECAHFKTRAQTSHHVKSRLVQRQHLKKIQSHPEVMYDITLILTKITTCINTDCPPRAWIYMISFNVLLVVYSHADRYISVWDFCHLPNTVGLKEILLPAAWKITIINRFLWPLGYSTTNCKHNTDILWAYKVDMVWYGF